MSKCLVCHSDYANLQGICAGHQISELRAKDVKVVAKRLANRQIGFRVLFQHQYNETPFIYDVASEKLYNHEHYPVCYCEIGQPDEIDEKAATCKYHYEGYRTENGVKSEYRRELFWSGGFKVELKRDLRAYCESLQVPPLQ